MFWPWDFDWTAAMMTEPLPDGYVVHLPPPKAHRQPHIFGDAVTIPPETSDTGFEQKEKSCRNCGAVRVTILGEAASRAWRAGAGAPLIEIDTALPCPSKAAP